MAKSNAERQKKWRNNQKKIKEDYNSLKEYVERIKKSNEEYEQYEVSSYLFKAIQNLYKNKKIEDSLIEEIKKDILKQFKENISKDPIQIQCFLVMLNEEFNINE